MKSFFDSREKTVDWTCPSCFKSFNSGNDSMNAHITYCLLEIEKRLKEKSTFAVVEDDTEELKCPICKCIFKDVTRLTTHADICLDGDKKKFKRIKHNDEKVIDYTNISTINQLPGLFLIHEFITEDEEQLLIKALENDSQKWRKYLFNGEHLVKQFGLVTQHGIPGDNKTGYVRRNNVDNGEPNLPSYFQFLIERVMTVLKHNINLPVTTKRELDDFIITECNCNCYIKSENHHVNYHFDDRGLSGKALINLSLISAGSMRYKKNDDDIIVSLPRRTLQIVSGEARWSFKHAIFASGCSNNY